MCLPSQECGFPLTQEQNSRDQDDNLAFHRVQFHLGYSNQTYARSQHDSCKKSTPNYSSQTRMLLYNTLIPASHKKKYVHKSNYAYLLCYVRKTMIKPKLLPRILHTVLCLRIFSRSPSPSPTLPPAYHRLPLHSATAGISKHYIHPLKFL